MFQIIWAIVAGLIIGVIAKLILPGRQPIPIWLTVVLGVVGALIGNWISSAIGVRHTGGVDWVRHALQIGAAMALIALISPMYLTRRGSRL
jgi:uncharacterized membrane protein YeaQ/YmgE (transglycosylase-associated protein family)